MKAYIKVPGKPPQFQDIPEPVLAPGKAILRILYVGLCRTDLYVASELIWRSFPLILGHEFSAEVIAVNPDSKFKVGQRVTVNPLWGKDFMGLHFDGILAEKALIPEDKMYLIPDGMDAKLAAYAEPVAASLATSKVVLQGRGGIYGNNRIATLTALILATRGIQVPILNENAPLEEDSFDFLIETVLSPGDMKKLCWALRPGGLLVMKSRKAEEVSFPVNLAVLKDITMQGVSYGDWNSVLPWIEYNHTNLRPLLGDTYQFNDCDLAFSEANKAESNKTFIQVGQE